MARIANGGRVPSYQPKERKNVWADYWKKKQEALKPKPTKDLSDVLPWAVDIAPYEDFYTRSVISFLDWSAANKPEYLTPWIGGQPTPAGVAPAGVAPAGVAPAGFVAPPAFAPPTYGAVRAAGGRAAGLPEPKFTMADIMQYMEFPQVWQYPSYMRDFGRYIEELLVQNPEYAVPLPELGEEGEIIPTPEDLDKLAYMETAENYAAAWNDFLQSLVNLPFFQQQEMLGLRYTPATRWYRSGQIPMLPHPEYL